MVIFQAARESRTSSVEIPRALATMNSASLPRVMLSIRSDTLQAQKSESVAPSERPPSVKGSEPNFRPGRILDVRPYRSFRTLSVGSPSDDDATMGPLSGFEGGFRGRTRRSRGRGPGRGLKVRGASKARVSSRNTGTPKAAEVNYKLAGARRRHRRCPQRYLPVVRGVTAHLGSNVRLRLGPAVPKRLKRT